MTAKDILNLIAARHTDDLFVPECKDGPSWGGGHLRMDAWVMNRSWAHPLVTGYEIKVSRSDFLQDKKWPFYLAGCNEFFFACPHGLIKPEELPAEAGLLWVSQTGSKLYTKKKPLFRTPEIPESLWRYVLMCRAEIKEPGYYRHPSRLEQWQDWIKEKEENRRFGHITSRKIRTVIKEKIDKVEIENDRLKSNIKEYEAVKRILSNLGLDPETPYAWTAERKIKDLQKIVPPDFEKSIESLSRGLESIKDQIQQLKLSEQKEANNPPTN